MTKFLILAVIVMVVAGGFFIDHSDDGSDYTILESEENIVEGLIIETNDTNPSMGHATEKDQVLKVADGKVSYSVDKSYKYDVPVDLSFQLKDFAPNGYITYFDYTSSELPEEITVTVIDDVYVLNGNYGRTYLDDQIYIGFTDLAIEYDGKTVISVEGHIDVYVSTPDDYGFIETIADLETVDENILGTGGVYTYAVLTADLEEFYAAAIWTWDASKFEGCDIKESQGKIGEVDAIVYTINGASKGFEYKDFKVYTYQGYCLKLYGMVKDDPNGEFFSEFRVVKLYIQEPEPESPYRVLESTDNITEGMRLEINGSLDVAQTASSYTEVDRIDGDTVYYTATTKTDFLEPGVTTLQGDDFGPMGDYIGFNYVAGDIPETVTVTADGNKYTLNGSYEMDYKDFHRQYAFDNLTIELGTESIISVNGGFEIEFTALDGSKDYYSMEASIVTIDGIVTGTGSLIYVMESNIAAKFFYKLSLISYNEDRYEGCTITESYEEFEGITATVYTVNGVTDMAEYQDFDVYVYEGFIIKETGLVKHLFGEEFLQYDNLTDIYVG